MENVSLEKTGIIYCRVSSHEQVEGTSLESQERLCHEYAARNGIKVLGEPYIEKGESAKTANRTEFNKAITFCSSKKNHVDFFIVYKIDRFARNQDDHTTVRAILHRSGTELRSVTEPISESPVGKVLEGMLSVFAEFDNNVRMERVRGGMQERVRHGIWCWGAPHGYHRLPQAKNISPNPVTAPYIKLGFEEWSKGIYTYQTLADFLTDRGMRLTSGRRPYAQFIEKMLRNPIYCGIIDVWGERLQGSFDAIISQDLFARCQAGYKDGSAHKAKRSKNNELFPLRRLVVCSDCKKPLTASRATGRHGGKYPHYHHQRQGCIKASFVPKEAFEQSFFEYLEQITPNGEFEQLFKDIVIDIWKTNYRVLDEENARIRKEIGALELERQRVFDFHRAQKYTDDEFSEQKRFVNERIEQKRTLLNEKWDEELDMEHALDYCFSFVRNVGTTWKTAGYSLKAQLQRRILKSVIEFDGERFGTAQLSKVFELAEKTSLNHANKKSPADAGDSLVVPTGIEPVLPH